MVTRAPIFSRLQRHARKFQHCKATEVVLKRYLSKAPKVDNETPQQYMSHVSARIALAQPPNSAASQSGDLDLSPVRVLTSMLRFRGRKHLTDRLLAALRAVSSCFDAIIAASTVGPPLQHEDDWRKLSESMPTLHQRVLTEANKAKHELPQAGTSEDANDVAMFQRLQRLQRSVSLWKALKREKWLQTYIIDEQEGVIVDLKESAHGTLGPPQSFQANIAGNTMAGQTNPFPCLNRAASFF